MKKHLIATGLLLAATAVTFAADAVKSGPQVGQKVPGPFEPLNINVGTATRHGAQYHAPHRYSL